MRPEHIAIGGDGLPGTGSIDATVDLEEPMGADSLIWVRIGEQSLSVRTESSRRYQPGDQVQLALDLSRASIFDANQETRI